MSIAITTSAFPSLRRGVAASFTLAATSTGTGPILWVSGVVEPGTSTTLRGHLPRGLSLDETTGVISGVPQESGPFSVQIAAGDVATSETTYAIFSGVVSAGVLIDAEGAAIDPSNVGRLEWYEVIGPRYSIDVGGALYVADNAANGGRTFVYVPEFEARTSLAEDTLRALPNGLPAGARIVAPQIAVG